MRKNLVTMVGTLKRCLLFMYRCPAAKIRPHVPNCFQLVTVDGQAIIGVVVSELTEMRPRMTPDWLGVSYCHIAYRVYVRFTTPQGSSIEGLYFLRSDADSRLMTLAGNVLSTFRFHLAHVNWQESANSICLSISRTQQGIADASARLDPATPAQLSEHSCFASVAEAMEVLRYEPYGMAYDPRSNTVNVVKVTRDERRWHERPLTQVSASWSYLDRLTDSTHLHELTIAVDSIPYRWERGVVFFL
ncbi:DUF2071 domain-containing protein [Brevibacillus humidisoli]|uniref:DUF2071 domain-containing protein n=1 Tax=Brevibacillus humidisoli TaxID=2895522 RepID=UPI001E534E0C|nr:DUF2071 domain-containing protein [Brevibacillus humidisoli]UFJ41864.1 DUF2071 domain-containing protein [Brevibacillus humidisoli]